MRPRYLTMLGILILATALLATTTVELRALWPPVVALAVIGLTRRALLGLLAGAYAGSVLLSGGDPWQAYLDLFGRHLASSLSSSWKLGAILFTLLLGGFAALLDSTGGFAALLQRWTAGHRAARRFELAALGLGLACFFDGLANSMLVGRVGRGLADRCGVTRVKLAYIVDSTSSAVACVAPLSTWIAFQLTMIDEGYRLAGLSVNPYAAFVASLPYNFHCWFTLVLLAAAIWWRFEPGPMARYGATAGTDLATPGDQDRSPASPVTALLPLALLLVSFLVLYLALGSPRPWWPPTRDKLVAAFGSEAGPLVMVLAAILASMAAFLCLPANRRGRWQDGLTTFRQGASAMLLPLLILVAAWMLGSVIQDLGTADLMAGLVARVGAPALVPLATFLVGALVSFATGTSWGTMGLLFPLAIPAAAVGGMPEALLPTTVAAVFSGAVFGDHCSPFSDTTIVTAVACGVEPHDHVRTQMPYALLAAGVAALAGFLPAGLGVAPWWSLAGGVGVLISLARWRSRT